MVESGAVREQNAIATYAKNVLDLTTGSLIAVLWGYQLAYDSGCPLRGGLDSADKISFFLYLTFQATAATIVSGAMAERTSLMGYLTISCWISGLVFPLATVWTWGGGFLSTLDPPYHDFAGSGVVHVIGGATALVGAWAVGPRMNRWDPVFAADFVPHNVPSILAGMLFLWVGWYGFNPGSTGAMSTAQDIDDASNAVATTTIAAATGGTAHLVTSWLWNRRRSFDILGFANVILGSLVAITAGADVIDLRFSTVVGVVAVPVYLLAVWARTLARVDDVVDAFAIHCACGIWGVLAVGLFDRNDGLITTGRAALLGSQLLGAFVLTAFALAATSVLVIPLLYCGWLRAAAAHESRGLDELFFGMRAYAHHSAVLQRQREVAALLATHGHTPAQLLDALVALRGIIYRTLTPQAADGKLEGEVRDIIKCLTFENESTDGAPMQHLGFISHHKMDAGDAARIFRDTSCRILTSNLDQVAITLDVLQRLNAKPGGRDVPRSLTSLGASVRDRSGRQRSGEHGCEENSQEESKRVSVFARLQQRTSRCSTKGSRSPSSRADFSCSEASLPADPNVPADPGVPAGSTRANAVFAPHSKPGLRPGAPVLDVCTGEANSSEKLGTPETASAVVVAHEVGSVAQSSTVEVRARCMPQCAFEPQRSERGAAERLSMSCAEGSSACFREDQWAVVQRLGRDDLFFLDSSNLKDLPTLLHSVKRSANFILLLSKETLERPYILAELCVAHQAGVNICVVLIEFTARELDTRAFRFPASLEKAIEEVSWYILQEGGRERKPKSRRRRTAGMHRGAPGWSGLQGLLRWRHLNSNREAVGRS